MQNVCAILYCHLWPVWLHNIFPHHLMNEMIFGKKKKKKKLLNTKCAFNFLYKFSRKKFIILRRIQWSTIINVRTSSCKVPVILVRSEWNLNFLDRFSYSAQISNLMKIRPVGAELLHADGLTDWLSYWLTDCLTDWLSYWMTILLTDWLSYWLSDWLTVLLID